MVWGSYKDQPNFFCFLLQCWYTACHLPLPGGKLGHWQKSHSLRAPSWCHHQHGRNCPIWGGCCHLYCSDERCPPWPGSDCYCQVRSHSYLNFSLKWWHMMLHLAQTTTAFMAELMGPNTAADQWRRPVFPISKNNLKQSKWSITCRSLLWVCF